MASGGRRILLFGGTFDPPHLAHARLPAFVAPALSCSEIVYIPANVSPHKTETPPVSNDHRLAMLALAIADVDQARISTIELGRNGPSFFIDTLMALKEDGLEDTTIFFLIGADQALSFAKWHRWEEILTLASPVVMVRPPWTASALGAALHDTLPAQLAKTMEAAITGVPELDIDATTIRKRLERGEPTDGLLDNAVRQYINENNLYGVRSGSNV